MVSFQQSLIMPGFVGNFGPLNCTVKKGTQSQPMHKPFKQKWSCAWAIITFSTHSTVTHLILMLQSAAAKQQMHKICSAFLSPLNISQSWRQDRQRTQHVILYTNHNYSLLSGMLEDIHTNNKLLYHQPSGIVTQESRPTVFTGKYCY